MSHNTRSDNFGNTEAAQPLSDEVAERFWSKVGREPGGCWRWMSSVLPNGYGQFWLNGGPQYAHRVAWMLAHGVAPEGQICHHCDNRRCVNPTHLYDGSQLDNMRDCVERRRLRPRGQVPKKWRAA